MKKLLIILCLGFILIDTNAQCLPEEIINLKKTALVFGEKSYKFAPALNNPVNDAKDITDSLRKIGFKVYPYYDADLKTMINAIDDWCSIIKDFDVALFYYSGHGAEVKSENFLFPIDQDPKGPSDLYYMAISANRVLDRMEANKTQFNILILDACRNNPFTKSWGRDFIGKGLAPMYLGQASKGTFIAFAAATGKTASDGSGRNGTFTEGILKNIMMPNSTIDQIFTKVTNYVKVQSSGDQNPYKTSSLGVDFCFSVKYDKKQSQNSKSQNSLSENSILLTTDEENLIVPDSSGSGFLLQDAQSLISLGTAFSSIHPHKIIRGNPSTIYVIDKITSRLAILDYRNQKIIAEIQLKKIPVSFTISADEKKAFISETDTDSTGLIEIVDLTEKKSIKSILYKHPIGKIAISQDGKTLYITSFSKLNNYPLLVFDIKSEKVLQELSNTSNGLAIAVVNENKKIYATSTNSEGSAILNIIDANSLKVIKHLNIIAEDINYDKTRGLAIITNKNGVVILETKEDKILKKLPFATSPKGFSLSSSGQAYFWLPNENRIFTLDLNAKLQEADKNDPEEEYSKFREEWSQSRSDDINHIADKIWATISSKYYAVVRKIVDDLGDPFTTIQSGASPDYKNLIFSNSLGITSKWDEKKKIWPKCQMTISGNSIKLLMIENQMEESFQTSVYDPDYDGVSKFIRSFFITRINQLK